MYSESFGENKKGFDSIKMYDTIMKLLSPLRLQTENYMRSK